MLSKETSSVASYLQYSSKIMKENNHKLPHPLDAGNIVLMKNDMSASVTPPPVDFSSRLEYWESATGVRNPRCAHEICTRPATHGAIARRAFSSDKTRYVFPACETCVRRTEMLYVRGPIVEIE